MKLRLPIAIVVLALCAMAGPARAETEGRVSLTNAYTEMHPNEAVIDAALVRIWLRSERIGGRNLSFVVDARSDVILKDTPVSFNDWCRGAQRGEDCDTSARNVTMGQLSHLAGIYDLYLMIGSVRPGGTAFTVGRRTFYEAGLVTIDGVAFEKAADKSRFGVFGGLQPDPFTRMVNASYPTVGGYWAYQNVNQWIRFGAFGQGYLGGEPEEDAFSDDPKSGLDRASLFNQNFFRIANGVSLATFLQFDAVPAEDRLAYVDLTYRPSGRYRLRLNLTRYRPVAFELSPQLRGPLVDPDLYDEYRALNPRAPFGRPEVVPDEKLTSAVNMGKVVGHYVTANSITPYVALEYRAREIDGKSAIHGTLGAYTYDPYDTGITARLRFQYQAGYESTALRLGGWLEREMGSPNFILGGGAEAVQVAYDLGPLEVNYPKNAVGYFLHANARYEKPAGIGAFFEVQHFSQVRTRGENEPVPLVPQYSRPSRSATELTTLVGVSYRF